MRTLRVLLWIVLLPLALFLAAAVGARVGIAAAHQGPALTAAEADLLFDAGLVAYDAGELERALLCWGAIPPGHRHRARARRFMGWKVHALARDDPRAGLGYVSESLLLDPFEGNAWQDAWRIYAAALGLRRP